MIFTERFKRRTYLLVAVTAWLAAAVLMTVDLTDGHLGVEFRLGTVITVLASLFTILAWLEWHLPALSAAFEIGVATGDLKAGLRENVIRLHKG